MESTLENVRDGFNKVLPEIFGEGWEAKIRKDEGDLGDFVVVGYKILGDFACGLYQVFSLNMEVDSITGKKIVPGLLVQHVEVIRGCRTLPNGDPGYPDDEDYVDDGYFRSVQETLAFVCEAIARQRVEDVLITWEMERLAMENAKDNPF